jgi:hypothetical protein
MRLFIGITSGIIFFVLVSSSFFLPLPTWILFYPAIALAIGQTVAMWCPVAHRIFQFGDYIYYLVLGTMLGLGGMIVENGSGFSSFLSQEARQSDESLLASTEIKIREIEADIARNKTQIERAQSATFKAKERAGQIGAETYRACLAEEAMLGFKSRLDRKRSRYSEDPLRELVKPLVPFECPAIEDSMVETLRATIALRSARRNAEQLEQELAGTTTLRDDVVGRLSRYSEGNRWPWEDLSEKQRRFYLFQIFPCLLLIGIVIKIGKTTTGILIRDDRAGQ